MLQVTRSVILVEVINEFIERWQNVSGNERANYQLFLTELCAALALPKPDPASSETSENVYVFERRVDIYSPDGSVNRGYIDLYKRGCFALEAKQTGKEIQTVGWDKAMLAAQRQADTYIRALPSDEGRPPFIVVVDVGRSIELYSEFSRSGGTYLPFPDPVNHRIRLADLRKSEIQERIYALWTNPDELDASKHAARVTRELSGKLATLAKSLEKDGHPVEQVAHFLKRCLFTMFSEDTELIPKGSFTHLLIRLQKSPEHFSDAMRSLWETMNSGGYEGQIMERLRKFNGGLFHDINPVSLNSEQIGLLIEAGKADWRYVEPAIFGTLLERALDPRERHKLGAHYTPRAYVERLVIPTVIEPLREQWETVQVVAQAWIQKDKPKKALEEIEAFHLSLCKTRVLDPACGSGNFLYVAMEHFKRLEGEVLNVIRDLRGGQTSFDTEGITVDPHQFLGLEINPRAAAITELVLWIGYLQWHHRLYGTLNLPEPVLKDFHTIEYRDALLEYDRREPLLDDNGNSVMIWDGRSMKLSPSTGELIPDETKQEPVYRYRSPRQTSWPEADYIVGNPPYLGARRIRTALGDGYLSALRSSYPDIPEHADYVMYWWWHSAASVAARTANRFGLITTNSLRQSFSRKVVEKTLQEHPNLAIKFVVPDHPWVDSADGAAVRVSLISVGANSKQGIVSKVVEEEGDGEEGYWIRFITRKGRITPNLDIGVDPGEAHVLKSNAGISSVGYQITGKGFVLSTQQRSQFTHGLNRQYIKPLMSANDITQKSRELFAIDLYDITLDELFNSLPELYQWLSQREKPNRDQNRDSSSRGNWWIFARPRADFRSALTRLKSIVVTPLTSKHRLFVVTDHTIICDSTTVMFAVDDAFFLGVLSSRLHTAWAFAAGGSLGMYVGNVRYNKTRCFETFPFPEVYNEHSNRIRSLAEQIDSHRKARQKEHENLTLTGMYNVLEKLRAGHPLTQKERKVNEHGLVAVLQELHDDLDRAVFAAYGWSDLAERLIGFPGATTPLTDKPEKQTQAEEELLSRLEGLNTKRAAEEAIGYVRWLRPDYQAPEAAQTTIHLSEEEAKPEISTTTETKSTWPKTMPEQVAAVQNELQVGPQSSEILAKKFKRRPEAAVEQILKALEVLGKAKQQNGKWYVV